MLIIWVVGIIPRMEYNLNNPVVQKSLPNSSLHLEPHTNETQTANIRNDTTSKQYQR